MTSDLNYFPNIRPIWDEYQNKKLSLSKRDILLKPYRDELYKTKVNDPHALPTRNIEQPTKAPTHSELNQLTADWYGVSLEEIE